MPELTLNDPLSGAEIKEIILQEIEKRLNGDSTLQNDLTYAGFRAKFDIRVTYVRSNVKETLVWGETEQPAPEGVEVEAAGETEIKGDYTSPDAPNLARTSHDLPVPVMISTPSGSERRKVQIERAGRKPGRPSNAELAARAAEGAGDGV